MGNIFGKSEKFKQEYCCSIVRIGELAPVENSDNLVKTIINGRTIISNKKDIRTGDVMFYADNETQLKAMFLQVNNQFRDYRLNINHKEIEACKASIESARKDIEKIEKDSADPKEGNDMGAFLCVPTVERLQAIIESNEKRIKEGTGFFEDNGRVRMIRLRGSYSMGYVFPKSAMEALYPEIRDINLDDYVGEQFDTVCGTLFVKAYVPKIKSYTTGKGHANKRLKSYDKLIEGEFMFHYDTAPLHKVMDRFEPEQTVVISRKIHGTSAIFANVKVRVPHTIRTGIGLLDRFLNKVVPERLRGTDVTYDHLYSSRRVILNRYMNDKPETADAAWRAEWNERFAKYVPEGWTMYGELVGYYTGTSKGVQSNYDYGCDEGTSKLMVYRITKTGDDGSKTELEVDEVQNFMKVLINTSPELEPHIMLLDIVYRGRFCDLYPEIPTDDVAKWREYTLERMKSDERFHMEKDEPLCRNKVPAEGVVLRIVGDPLKEAFKLKCEKFLDREAKLIDKGEVDAEMAEEYGEE